ncbi:MAG TPA: autotransporter outer membrane beta-barrel domain-containing protein [Steroidobacteraceae bacterium]|nr:autotransporter outer membrane beta-barrel domain-containing protein [Steroidobacteraceae bacterium]
MRLFACGIVVSLALCGTAGAQQVTGSLVDAAEAFDFNLLERAAARANQATYNVLVGPCEVQQTCSASDLVVFEKTRELVETANELLGAGSSRFSLGLDSEGLGFALRWTAAEEMAGQGSSQTKFTASQLSALATRLSVLRWGVSGLRRVDNYSGDDGEVLLADGGHARGGGASSDGLAESHRWGSFIDGSFGYGSKEPTALEDAFDFDGQEVTIGLDYRFSPAFVAGAIFGYSDKEIDFDSSLSIVDGGIVSDGYSGILFGMLEGEHGYLTASLGYQTLSHDTTRRITYPSLNVTVPSVDSTATSSADSSAFLATASGGYAFRLGTFAIEPSVDVTYSDTTVDAFTESSVDTLNGVPNDPFNMRVGKQSIESLDVAPALKLQYVFTPRFGAIIPYVIGRYHLQLSDDARAISARYADAISELAGVAGTDFAVSTDEPDEEYYTAAGGITLVFGSGLNGYLQYLKVFDLDHYDDAVITGGFRYEF